MADGAPDKCTQGHSVHLDLYRVGSNASRTSGSNYPYDKAGFDAEAKKAGCDPCGATGLKLPAYVGPIKGIDRGAAYQNISRRPMVMLRGPI